MKIENFKCAKDSSRKTKTPNHNWHTYITVHTNDKGLVLRLPKERTLTTQ